ncbi:dioxygenase family protein [Portibacter lacus]|uniref:Intradiol ring-cleavage dioxygenases domain-containing protein n=1 Tax=Portibacter lacus TaxID=1099794 RepID=A0AA37SMS4_9BACT|nr:hypothetical protein [Portibacter lacus]GLR17618.1 hypothetical protein GCM10007940_22330 [Portibacter lacus]
MNSKNDKRRKFLKLGLGATAGLITSKLVANQMVKENTPNVLEESCETTLDQTLGPFYPHVKNGDGDVDLTTIQGKQGEAEGEKILIRGIVRDENCEPIANALVELWQANHHGRYSHEGDAENPSPLDPNFEGWGQMTTDASGSFGFKTIKPASYAFADPSIKENWRTPHLHWKVSRRGFHELITQTYFKGEKLNKTDGVIALIPKGDQGDFILSPIREENGIPLYEFMVNLKMVESSEQRIKALSACVGKYEMNVPLLFKKMIVSVKMEDKQLFLKMPDYATVELKYIGKDEFDATSMDARLVFNRSEDGSVNSITVHNSFDKSTVPTIAPRV